MSTIGAKVQRRPAAYASFAAILLNARPAKDPRSSFSEWNRKDRAVAVNRVEPKQQRDLSDAIVRRRRAEVDLAAHHYEHSASNRANLAREFEMFGAEFAVCFAVELL